MGEMAILDWFRQRGADIGDGGDNLVAIGYRGREFFLGASVTSQEGLELGCILVLGYFGDADALVLLADQFALGAPPSVHMEVQSHDGSDLWAVLATEPGVSNAWVLPMQLMGRCTRSLSRRLTPWRP